MSRTARALAALAAVALLAAGCSGDDGTDATTAATTAPDDPVATTAPVGDGLGDAALEVVPTDVGPALALPDGQVLYAFLEDVDGVGSCTGDCAATWPPVAAADVTGADGVELGAVTRADGVTQLTVEGRPVYTFSGDLPGEATCQGGDGVWWVLHPDGTVNETPT